MNNKLLKIIAIAFAAAALYVAFLAKQSYRTTSIMRMIHGTGGRTGTVVTGRKGCRSLYNDDYLGI